MNEIIGVFLLDIVRVYYSMLILGKWIEYVCMMIFLEGGMGGGVKVIDGGWIKIVILICGNLDYLICLME